MNSGKKKLAFITGFAVLFTVTMFVFTALFAGCSPGNNIIDPPDLPDPPITPVDPTPNPEVTDGEIDYTKLKLNEVSGVGQDAAKFYELINIGDEDIPLEGVKIYYNANSNGGGAFPPNDDRLTWTGLASQKAEAGKLFSLIGRGTAEEGKFTTGLTAARILIITLKDPSGTVIDRCIRAADTGEYAITDKSFSRIPDGTGDFYFTTPPTPDETNGTSTEGLTLVPQPAPSAPVIGTVTQQPISSQVSSNDEVTVKATVTDALGTITSVTLQWKLNGAAQTEIPMTSSGDVYSAEIPAQAANSEVEYQVCATNDKDLTTTSDSETYTVKAVVVAVDYSKLVLNEVSGVGDDPDKFYELKNIGSANIPLEGVKIYYKANGSTGGSLLTEEDVVDSDLTWTGLASHGSVAAGQLFSLIGRDTTSNPNPGSFTKGLTAGRILIIILKDPDGNVIDKCIRAADTGDYTITNKSFSRIPDGTGPFYFTTPTPEATNGTDTTGLTLVPQTPPAPPPVDPSVDYSKLKLNEVNGLSGQKWFEIYNTGDVAISLENVKAYYNNGSSYAITWTGTSTQTIAAKGYFQVTGLITGLSANNKDVKLQLRAPDETVLDTYQKKDGYAATGTVMDKVHARIPDGTGDWYYLTSGTATPGATNGTTTTGNTKFGEEESSVPPVDPGVDYSKLVLNEVNGVDKWFEIYNTGDVAINLEGVTAYYNSGSSYNTTPTWTGTSSHTIAAKGFFSTKGTTLGTGLSANNANVKLQLRAPDGTILDTYQKKDGVSFSNTQPLYNKSHGRIPDGGDWYYFTDGTGTSGASNGTSTTGCTKFGEE